ncbi:hypothetical protein Tco_1142482 [Tanacetum coccineum]
MVRRHSTSSSWIHKMYGEPCSALKEVQACVVIKDTLCYSAQESSKKRKQKLISFQQVASVDGSCVPNQSPDNIKTRQLGDSGDDDSDDVTNDDVNSDVEGDNEASDSERTNSDEDENPNLNQNDDEEEEYEEEYVYIPDNYEFSDDDEEYEELYKDMNSYEQVEDDAHVTLTAAHVTQKTEGPMQSSSVSSDFASQLDNVPPTDNEVVSMMNVKVRHEEPSTQTSSLLTIHVTVILEISTADATTTPLIILPITPLPQQSTPTPTPSPTTETTTTLIPALLDFSSLFGFDQRVSILEKELYQLKEADYSTQLLETIKSQIPTMKKAQGEKKRYIDLIEKSVKDIIEDEVKSQLPQILPNEVSDYATSVIQSTITESLKNVVLAKSSSQSKSTYEAAASLTEDLYDGQVKYYKFDMDLFESYGKAYSLKRDREDKDKDEDPPVGSDHGLKRRKTSKNVEPLNQKNQSQAHPKAPSLSQNHMISRIAQAEKPPLTFDKLMSTLIDFLAYVMNNLKTDNLTQEHLVGPAFNLLKGTCRSQVEVEYHFEECYKAVTDRLDWNNPEVQEYPFYLSKPLPLIEDRGRQVVPVGYFINNDLDYLKGGSSSRKYTTSTTKTKAAKYDDIQGIEDMVPSLWSLVKVAYDRYVVWGITHWGPKRQRFYGFASNRVSKHNVFASKRIIAVTHVKVMKWEGDFPRLNLHDIEYMLLLLVQKKISNLERDVIFVLNVALWMFTRCVDILKWVEDLQLGVKSYQKKLNITKLKTLRSYISSRTPYIAYNNPQGIIYVDKYKRNKLMRSDELYKFSDRTLTSVRTVLHDIASNLRMDYLPKRKWSNLD